MGLSIDNIRLLTLTQRKADLEYNIAIDSMEKMAIAREQSQLSQEYYETETEVAESERNNLHID